jgi:hypothetical protein
MITKIKQELNLLRAQGVKPSRDLIEKYWQVFKEIEEIITELEYRKRDLLKDVGLTKRER